MNTITVKTEDITFLPDRINIEIPLSILKNFLVGKKKNNESEKSIIAASTMARKRQILKDAWGSWKDKSIDPLDYQRKMRAEWD